MRGVGDPLDLEERAANLSGVQRMIAACRDDGLPAPVWEEIGFRVRVTLRTEVIRQPSVDPKDRTILGLLEGSEGRATRDIAEAIGLSTRSTRTRLARLVKRGLVREVGTGPNDPRRVYLKAAGVELGFGRISND